MAAVLRIAAVTAVFVFILAGCAETQNSAGVPDKVVEPDIRKGELLSEIENKYENPDAHYQLGKIYHSEGQLDKAQFHYNVALGFDPVHHKAQAAMVKVLADQGDVAKSELAAEFYFNQAKSSAERLVLLGQAFQNEGLEENAIECFKKGLALAPTSAAIHRKIGFYYLSQGDKKLAEEYLRRSFQLNPYQADVAGQLGKMGVIVQVPRKTQDGKDIDKIIEDQQGM
jgi:tetratricopeptide (TPR) repeat protein